MASSDLLLRNIDDEGSIDSVATTCGIENLSEETKRKVCVSLAPLCSFASFVCIFVIKFSIDSCSIFLLLFLIRH
jgi:hypothetical protein